MLLLGIVGTVLDQREHDWIAAGPVSGVILGAHNAVSREQLLQLVADLREVRPDEAFVIGMDRSILMPASVCEGFTRLPTPEKLGRAWDVNHGDAVDLAEEYAWLMASECRATDIDFVFAPCLDMVGAGAGSAGLMLHADSQVVAELGQAMVRGMRLAGMSAVPGDFPGRQSDARQPFADAMAGGAEAITVSGMFSGASGRATKPARDWINDVLRGELDFRGLVIADETCPLGADAFTVARHIHACHDAGCDLIVVHGAGRIEAALGAACDLPPCDPADVITLRGTVAATWSALEDNPQRDEFIARVQALDGEQSR